MELINRKNGLSQCITPLPMDASGKMSDYEFLCWVKANMDNLITQFNSLLDAWNALRTYVNDYFENLDVQTEINNKLDGMIEDGTFYSMFAQTVITYSQPTFVDSVGAMTNVNRLYVLTTNGHLYQYTNNEWTDTQLIYATVASNYFVLMTQPTNLNTLTQFGAYFHSSTHPAASNTPNDSLYANNGFLLLNYANTPTEFNTYQFFMSYDDQTFWIRNIQDSVWTDWTRIATLDNIYNLSATCYTFDELPSGDLNNIKNLGFIFHGSSMQTVTNGPSGLGNVFMLINIYYYRIIPLHYQFIYEYATNKIYCRFMSNQVWQPWVTINSNTIYVRSLDDEFYQIEYGKYRSNFIHYINNTINQNNWNIDSIYYGSQPISGANSEIIGPILEAGQSDFMGGVHGDETTTNLIILCDGVEWDYTTRVACNEVKIIMSSELYRVSTKEHIMNRNVTITFTYNKIKIDNSFIMLTNVTVARATNGGLLRMYNDINTVIAMNNYFSTTPPTAYFNNASPGNIMCTLGWTNGSLTIRNLYGSHYPTYSGFLNTFTDTTPISNKVYFDTVHTNTQFNSGDVISGSFEIVCT